MDLAAPLLVAAVPPATATDHSSLTGQSLLVSTELAGIGPDGPIDFSGTMTGALDCDAALPSAALEIAGNATPLAPFPGPFEQTVAARFSDGMLDAFDVEFTIYSGDTTITGTAHYPGGTADVTCTSFFDDDDVWVFRFSLGDSAGGGNAPLMLDYSATIVTIHDEIPDAGVPRASINLYCYGSPTVDLRPAPDVGHCFGTSTLSFRGDDGQASTGDGVSEESPSVVSIDNPAGGRVEITPVEGADSTSSYIVLGQSYIIEAAVAASHENPIRLTFQLHSSLLYDWEAQSPIDPSSVTVVRDGQAALNCGSTDFIANPDPCVHSREVDDDGNLTLVVLTSHASLWSVVALLGGGPTAAAIAEAVEALPAAAFKARGHREALVSRLTETQRSIDAGRDAVAVRQLANLRRQVDGCGSKADKDDWVVACGAQVEIRDLIDELIAHLGG